ncbi:MAG: sugar ABC transporter permease [Clostridia bacterium]|nr:sugar ABC transporter permease [Clostridia bacterium]
MKKEKKSRLNQNVGIVFSLPFIIGLLVFFIPTVFMGIRFAISDVSISEGLSFTFTGIKNIKYALRTDPKYFQLVLSDLSGLLTTLPIVLIFSLFVAVLLNSKVWGRSFFRVIFFLPVIACVGMLAAGANNLVMQTMTSSAQETENEALTAMSDIKTMLQNLSFSPQLISIVSGAANNIMDIVNRSGVQILIFLAGIQSISPSIYESANVEGASGWEVFWKITLPMISPMMIANVLFTFVDSITRSNTELVSYVQNMAFGRAEFGYAAAMSWFHYICLLLMLGILAVAVIIVMRVAKRNREGH